MNILKKIIFFIIDKTADSMNSAFGAVLGAVCALYFTKEGVSKVINNMSLFIFSQNIKISPLMLFAVISLIIAISYSLLIYSKNSNKKLEENNLENVKVLEPIQNFDFEAIYEECSYKLLKNEVCYERKITIKALKDNFKRFPFSFDYSEFKVIPLIKGDDIVYIDNSGYYNNYQYVLQSHVMKGEIANIHIRMTYENNSLVKHFFGKTIKYPIKTLCLKFYFDKSIKIDSIIRTHYEYYESKNILFSKPYKPNVDRQHEWIIDNPNLENYFRLSWKKASER